MGTDSQVWSFMMMMAVQFGLDDIGFDSNI